jgi:hypothetical protein
LTIERHADLFPKGGSVIENWVKHDLVASAFDSSLRDCDPEIEIDIQGTRYRILKDGTMTAY